MHKGVYILSHRFRSGSHDKSFFRRTASKSKDINVRPKIMRGGIRL